MRESITNLLVRYTFAVIGSIAAVWLRVELQPSYLDRVPFLLPFALVVIAVWFAGLGPALLAIALGILFANIYPVPGWIDVEPGGWAPTLLRFGVASVVIVLLIHRVQRTERKQRGENERRQSQLAKLAAIVENSDDAIVGKSLDGVITSWNAAAEHLYGYSAEEVIGRSIALIVPPERPDELRSILAKLERGERVEHFETVRLRKDGSRVEVSAAISPILGPTGKVIGAAAITRDVSERRAIEEALRESEERYRGIVSHAAVGIARASLAGRLLDVNPGLCATLGARREELVGRSYLDLVQVEDRDRAGAAIQLLVSGASDSESLDLRYSPGSADSVWVSVTISVIRSSDGKARSLVAVSLDVTQRRRTEATLRFLAEASESLSALVDYRATLQKVAQLAVPDFADWCVVDMVGQNGGIERLAVAHVDPTKVMLAQVLQERYPPDPDAPYGVPQVLKTGVSERVAELTDAGLERFVPDPERRRIVNELGLRSYMCVPLRLKERTLGVITFVAAESGRHYDQIDLGAAEDLARRAAIAIENARLYQELRASDRRKDEFLAVLSHELRNPLAPIRSGIDMLAMEGSKDSPELIELMRQQVEHLVRLVDDLLDLSRITRDRVELKRQIVELGPLVERSAAAMRGTLEERDQTLTIVQPRSPLLLDADPVRLLQVIENLLQNASKFSDAGGTIELRTEKSGDEASIRVRDHGIGMDSALLSRLFEPFTQADYSLDRTQGGLGVGLALVRGLVERHGGRVSASSPGLGMGSEFEVRLPLRRAAADGQERPQPIAATEERQRGAAQMAAASGAFASSPTSAAPPSRGASDSGSDESRRGGGAGVAGPRRVLVVDDNVAAAQMLSLLVTRLGGHQVETAHDGPSAVERVRATHPEIVLLDIGLPTMDGYEVGRTIRQDPRFDDVLIVALTGYGQEEDRRRSREAGIDEHLVKPAAIEDLERVLDHPKLRA